MKAFEWTNPANINEAVKMLQSLRPVISTRRRGRLRAGRTC